MMALETKANPVAEREHWLREAVATYERRLIAYATQITRDPAAAQDAVQATFLKLCRQDPQAIDPKLAEWLHTVCRHEAIDLLRKRRRHTTLGDGELDVPEPACPRPNPAEEGERRDSQRHVLRAVANLPPNQRDVFLLKFQQGMRYREIAEATGLSVGNVGFLLHTALRTLRTELRHDLALDPPSGATPATPSRPTPRTPHESLPENER